MMGQSTLVSSKRGAQVNFQMDMKLYIRTPHEAFFERCQFWVRLYSSYFGAEKNKAV